jgi:glycosyltransferase involved in cell wall biosynthesis
MKAVFAHDHVFVQWRDEIFSPGRLPYPAWGRYLEHFQHLTIIGRVRHAGSEQEVSRLIRADGPRVSFALLPGAQGIRRALNGTSRDQSIVDNVLEDADAVIARVPSRIGGRVAVIASTRQLPLALEVVGSALHSLWHHGSVAAKLYAPVLDLQTKRIARRASAALYVTRGYLQKRYPCPGITAAASNVVIPRPDHQMLGLRQQRILMQRERLIIGFVGTLGDRHKGLDTLMLALRALREAKLDFVLKVVGEGDSRQWKQLATAQGIADRVEFIGTLPGSAAVREWLSGIDVFVLPSKGGEGLPRALIEAMSCGCLAFATKVGGVSELLSEKDMFAPGDWRSLAEKLRCATDQSLLLEALTRNSAVAAGYACDILEQVRREFFAQLAQRAAARKRRA